MNIPMLRDADNDPGFYAAACGAEGWPGATLFVSRDGGASYQNLLSFGVGATIGRTLDVLGDFAGGNIPDELNSATVRLYHGSLSSTNFAGLLAGSKAALIGDEVLFFRDAVLISPNTYTLTGFLRGRRGTERTMSTHTISDRFVLLDVASLKRAPAATSDIGIEYMYKAVTNSTTLAATSAKSFTNTGAALMPYSVVQIGGGRNAADDGIINWTRRGRLSGEWRDGVDVPLGEASEMYDIEIWNSDYSTLKRTINTTVPTMTYSAADQTTDFGSPQSTIYFTIYQRSDVVGRGFPARGSI